MAPIGGVALFEKIRKHNFAGRNVFLGVGFEVSKTCSNPRLFLFLLPAFLDAELFTTALFLLLVDTDEHLSATS